MMAYTTIRWINGEWYDLADGSLDNPHSAEALLCVLDQMQIGETVTVSAMRTRPSKKPDANPMRKVR